MTIPCEQKETIAKLQADLETIKIKQAEIHGDIGHIKHRIDNGMSHTISNINKVVTELGPTIKHHGKVIGNIEDIGWWISKGAMAAIIAVIVWAISHGWKP